MFRGNGSVTRSVSPLGINTTIMAGMVAGTAATVPLPYRQCSKWLISLYTAVALRLPPQGTTWAKDWKKFEDGFCSAGFCCMMYLEHDPFTRQNKQRIPCYRVIYIIKEVVVGSFSFTFPFDFFLSFLFGYRAQCRLYTFPSSYRCCSSQTWCAFIAFRLMKASSCASHQQHWQGHLTIPRDSVTRNISIIAAQSFLASWRFVDNAWGTFLLHSVKPIYILHVCLLIERDFNSRWNAVVIDRRTRGVTMYERRNKPSRYIGTKKKRKTKQCN